MRYDSAANAVSVWREDTNYANGLTFDAQGWLRIGVSGSQPGLGEPYISTGSLYLCSVALLPLGLPASDAFWSTPAVKTTWEKIWSGENFPADHAIKSPR